MPDDAGPPLFRLDGRVALVTGAGRGIGRATARLLAHAGALVVVADIDADAAGRVADALAGDGMRAEMCAFDVADEAGVVGAIEGIASRHGAIDILVNNAGIASRAPAESLAREAWDRTFAVNATGAFLCAREAGRRMLAAGHGAIVNVASAMALAGRGLGPNGAYHASKGALVAWTRALACEWAARGVRVNAVAPGYVATPYVREAFAEASAHARIVDRQAIGRLIAPAEVAAAILFLASDAASAITGVTLPVDGGWTAG
jgi:NAD(P)-dependent dehydrogenase (short-subunit alcohol dehydrogenase family)